MPNKGDMSLAEGQVCIFTVLPFMTTLIFIVPYHPEQLFLEQR